MSQAYLIAIHMLAVVGAFYVCVILRTFGLCIVGDDR